MYEDNRTQYTKKKIQTSFFELLRQKPINKITVKAICDYAKINRSTFYRYYMDVYDLLEKTEENYIERFYAYAKRISTLENGLFVMLKEVNTNIEDYEILIHLNNCDSGFIDRVLTAAYDHYESGFQLRYPDLTDSEKHRIFLFLSQGCITITKDWVENGRKESPEKIAEFITDIYKKILV